MMLGGCARTSYAQYTRPVPGYDLCELLGQGNFGKVYKAVCRQNKQTYAVKVVQLNAMMKVSTGQHLAEELFIVQLLSHPNIVKVHDVITTTTGHAIVMDYCDAGELYDYVVHHERLEEWEAKQFMQQIVSALVYCHTYNVAHRDLKLENLLLDSDLNIKIIDFGLSKFYSGAQRIQTFCGSPMYAAPELLRGEPYKGEDVDVWSLGIIMYSLLTGGTPFHGETAQEIIARVQRGVVYHPRITPSERARDLIEKCLQYRQEERITLRQVAEHPWFEKAFDAHLPDTNRLIPIAYPEPTVVQIIHAKTGYENIEHILRTSSVPNDLTGMYFLIRDSPNLHRMIEQRPKLANRRTVSSPASASLQVPMPPLERNNSNLQIANHRRNDPIPRVESATHMHEMSVDAYRAKIVEFLDQREIKHWVANPHFVIAAKEDILQRFEIQICRVINGGLTHKVTRLSGGILPYKHLVEALKLHMKGVTSAPSRAGTPLGRLLHLT